MPYFVYILYSELHDKYYIGQTNSIGQRLERHNEFEVSNSYTSKYRPWILKNHVEVGLERKDAMKLERYLKSLKSKVRIAKIAESPDLFFETAQKILWL